MISGSPSVLLPIKDTCWASCWVDLPLPDSQRLLIWPISRDFHLYLQELQVIDCSMLHSCWTLMDHKWHEVKDGQQTNATCELDKVQVSLGKASAFVRITSPLDWQREVDLGMPSTSVFKWVKHRRWVTHRPGSSPISLQRAINLWPFSLHMTCISWAFIQWTLIKSVRSSLQAYAVLGDRHPLPFNATSFLPVGLRSVKVMLALDYIWHLSPGTLTYFADCRADGVYHLETSWGSDVTQVSVNINDADDMTTDYNLIFSGWVHGSCIIFRFSWLSGLYPSSSEDSVKGKGVLLSVYCGVGPNARLCSAVNFQWENL